MKQRTVVLLSFDGCVVARVVEDGSRIETSSLGNGTFFRSNAFFK
jgi:hypothetical protein